MRKEKKIERLVLSKGRVNTGSIFRYLPVLFFAFTSLTSLFLFLPLPASVPSMGGSAPVMGGNQLSLLELQHKTDFTYYITPLFLLTTGGFVLLASFRFRDWVTRFRANQLSLSFGIRAPPQTAH